MNPSLALAIDGSQAINFQLPPCDVITRLSKSDPPSSHLVFVPHHPPMPSHHTRYSSCLLHQTHKLIATEGLDFHGLNQAKSECKDGQGKLDRPVDRHNLAPPSVTRTIVIGDKHWDNIELDKLTHHLVIPLLAKVVRRSTVLSTRLSGTKATRSNGSNHEPAISSSSSSSSYEKDHQGFSGIITHPICDCSLSSANSECFSMTFLPKLPGKYYLAALMDGYHVAGSPFRVSIPFVVSTCFATFTRHLFTFPSDLNQLPFFI